MITQAFVLGAGLGTRLRPLTDELPKPLVPIFQKPLITFAFDHLIGAGCTKLIVNTHHKPEAYGSSPRQLYRDIPVHYRWEETLLETGGGIANVADLLGSEPFLVYNGDILTDLPLAALIDEHRRSGNVVTLALRSHGGPKHVAFDGTRSRVVDIRNQLGTGAPDRYVFTGIYAVEPAFMELLQPGVKRSVIPSFLELIRRDNALGGVVLDDGEWWDVGTREAYVKLHHDLPRLRFPAFHIPDADWRAPVHRTARIEAGATVVGDSVIGAGVSVGEDARIEDTIAWPGAQIASRTHLRNCIVRSHQTAQGDLSDTII